MLGSSFGPRCALSLLTAAAGLYAQAATPTANIPKWSPPAQAETLYYSVEWRLIPAGYATIALAKNAPGSNEGYRTEVHVTSSGLLDKLFRVEDVYHADYEGSFCAVESTMVAHEGKRQRETKIKFDRAHNQASSIERDLTANGKIVKQSEVTTPSCVQDLVGGLYVLRTLHLEPGQSTTIPVSDGKKSVAARIEAQEREEIKTKAGTFHTLRYEAYIFNNVLYPRNARLMVWVTDDARRIPVQMRVRMTFTIGTVTLSLDRIGEESAKLAK